LVANEVRVGGVSNIDGSVANESVQTGRGDSEEIDLVVSGEEGGSVSENGRSVEVPDFVAVSGVVGSGDAVSVEDGEVRSISIDTLYGGETCVIDGQEGKGGGV